jgi:hypothetical protein
LNQQIYEQITFGDWLLPFSSEYFILPCPLKYGKSNTQPKAMESLIRKLDLFETALMCVIWNDILQNINLFDKALLEAGNELCIGVKLYGGVCHTYI